MDCFAYKNNKLIGQIRAYSVGGGNVTIKGEKKGNDPLDKEVYPHNSYEEIKTYCEKNKLDLYQYILKFDNKELINHLKEV